MQPPCKRLDILNVIREDNCSCIIIADGFFHQFNAIGHREIREAIIGGVTVWGLSSIGAIRAYELRHFGMKGFGKVYKRFFSEYDFQDDEVALLHGPAPDYIKLSEPLIHMRLCIEDLIRKNKLGENEGREIIRILKQRYFGERTLEFFAETILKVTRKQMVDLISDFDHYRQKELDLVLFVDQMVWLHE